MNCNSSRRGFLSRLAAMGTGAVMAREFLTVHQSFAREIEAACSEFERFGVEQLRRQYLIGDDVTYLNHAAIGSTPKAVHEARVKYLRLCESNPWLYMWGGAWDEAREEVRAAAAKLIGCDTTELAITHNTTEMFNVLAHGLPWEPKDEVLFSTLCHDGASVPFLQFAHENGYQARRFEFPVERVPIMTADELVGVYAEQIRPETRLLVIPHIDNTVGLRYPVLRMAKMARDKGVEFVAVDGAQSVGMIDVDVSSMDVDIFATSPHKWLQSPKGLGLAYVHRRLHERLRPMWVTWGQQRWNGSARIFEDYGTRNLAELLSLGDAIDYWLTGPAARVRTTQLTKLWEYAKTIVDQHADLEWKSPRKWELSASLFAIGLKRGDAVKIAKQLFEDHKIVVRPFTTLGLNTLRVSPNVYNTTDEIDRLVEYCVA